MKRFQFWGFNLQLPYLQLQFFCIIFPVFFSCNFCLPLFVRRQAALGVGFVVGALSTHPELRCPVSHATGRIGCYGAVGPCLLRLGALVVVGEDSQSLPADALLTTNNCTQSRGCCRQLRRHLAAINCKCRPAEPALVSCAILFPLSFGSGGGLPPQPLFQPNATLTLQSQNERGPSKLDFGFLPRLSSALER